MAKSHGRLSLREIAKPAIQLAARGFPIELHLFNGINNTALGEVSSFFQINDSPLTLGSSFRNPALAKTLRGWAASEGEYLNTGTGAQAIANTAESTGGVISIDDLNSYQPTWREPVVIKYRSYTITTMSPPSSGGVALAEMFHALQNVNLNAYKPGTASTYHLLTEVMKHAFADRAHFLGDPSFVEVPMEKLTSVERGNEIAASYMPNTTYPPEFYGDLIAPVEDHGTLHISVVDAENNGIALTTTINTGFGSGVIVEELGIILNNEMDDFAAAPGVPNAFGLVGTEANSIQPGKRPLSSMSPTIVEDSDGNIVMVVGASGGSQIISSVFQTIVNVLDFGMSASEANSAPRVHHQWQPDILFIEPDIPQSVQDELKAMGHNIVVRWQFSSVQLVTKESNGLLAGAADPRKGGQPAGAF